MTKLAVHAGGYVGITAAIHYASVYLPLGSLGSSPEGHAKTIEVVISDPDPAVVEAINSGKPKAGSFLGYLGGNASRIGTQIKATTNVDEVLGADCHLIAVPSERNGEPYMDIVEKLFADLDEKIHPQIPIIVESTLMPGMAKRLRAIADGDGRRESRPWAIAPRRDWFADKDKNMTTLTRVVGVDNQHYQDIVPWIAPVSRDVQWTTPETAEITKALENALLHLPVVLLHELALLFPDYDIAEAARLASSHWRFRSMGGLYLALGTGGRCVSMGSRYLNERGGALLGDAIEIDDSFADNVLDEILNNIHAADCGEQYISIERAVVLGIGYRPGFKDAGNSPGVRVAKALEAKIKGSIYVMDPYFTQAEIDQACGFTCGLPYDPAFLAGADLVVLTVAHPEFVGAYTHGLRPHAVILDATGAWEGKPLGERIKYIRPGRPGWTTLNLEKLS